MEFSIPSDEFWNKTEDLHSHHNVIYVSNCDFLIDIGLKYLKSSTDLIHNKFVTTFIFEVIDKQKFLLAKIRYGF